MSARDDTSARALKTAGLVFISYHVACMVLLGAGVAWYFASNPLFPVAPHEWGWTVGWTVFAALLLLFGVRIGIALRRRAPSETIQRRFSRFVSPEGGMILCFLNSGLVGHDQRQFIAPGFYIVLGVLGAATYVAKVYLRRKFPRPSRETDA